MSAHRATTVLGMNRHRNWVLLCASMGIYAAASLVAPLLIDVATTPLWLSMALVFGAWALCTGVALAVLVTWPHRLAALGLCALVVALGARWFWLRCGAPTIELLRAVWASWRLWPRWKRRTSMVLSLVVLVVVEFGTMFAHDPAATLMTLAALPFVLLMILPAVYGIRQNIRNERAERTETANSGR